MINKDNLIAISTTIFNNNVSNRRRNTLINNFNKHNIRIILNNGLTKFDKIHRCFNNNLKRLLVFKESNYDYGLICDDDFFPIDNFIYELNKTVALLPNDWNCLHLCPGFLWGRASRDKSKIGHLNPDSSINELSFHESGRFFNNCNNKLYYSIKCWLGGPEAFIIKKEGIDKFIMLFTEYFRRNRQITDVIMTCMLNDRTFICREPQLGYEEENGGSTLK